MITVKVNGVTYDVDVPSEMPILWVLRDILGFTGTKFGCAAAQCGACMVHLNGAGIRSCITPVARAEGKDIVTIEGLNDAIGKSVQHAWEEVDVPQCGYCQSGQIMAATILLRENPSPSDKDIDHAMSGNICRCGTYKRIREAIHLAARK
ncbi:isoquinoline 1-oxidoreductase, alpha subunit [Dyadobacter soli]|uniref:Isoquinoline 1-oxidoreductase, alpha subunit n=1 Tax=Dyadobacter soli TaxID=659014 RepID=A0A1G7MF94_9BACT|nr:(2Fe-2S)-binding protein [Dyadobacter soli]SDF60498.1 isoquinoline 1-oxidoreductase, alpha subunit [Dyadobacter soli]